MSLLQLSTSFTCGLCRCHFFSYQCGVACPVIRESALHMLACATTSLFAACAALCHLPLASSFARFRVAGMVWCIALFSYPSPHLCTYTCAVEFPPCICCVLAEMWDDVHERFYYVSVASGEVSWTLPAYVWAGLIVARLCMCAVFVCCVCVPCMCVRALECDRAHPRPLPPTHTTLLRQELLRRTSSGAPHSH